MAEELDRKVPVHHGLHNDHHDNHGQVGGEHWEDHNVGVSGDPV